jgi:hypothetical protein
VVIKLEANKWPKISNGRKSRLKINASHWNSVLIARTDM